MYLNREYLGLKVPPIRQVHDYEVHGPLGLMLSPENHPLRSRFRGVGNPHDSRTLSLSTHPWDRITGILLNSLGETIQISGFRVWGLIRVYRVPPECQARLRGCSTERGRLLRNTPRGESLSSLVMRPLSPNLTISPKP